MLMLSSATRGSAPVISDAILISNLFHFIAVGSYSEYTVIAVFGTVDAIEEQVVAIDSRHLVFVGVTIDAEHQSWEEIEIAAERLAHIIIKLIAIWRGVHHQDGAIKLVGILCHLLLHKVKVGHSRQIVVLGGIGVETHKLDAPSDKLEIDGPIHHLKRLVACA